MIGDNALPPPPATNIDLQFISAMLATLSDPAASLKLLGEMQAARLAWAAAQDAAVAKMRESDAYVQVNKATMVREREEHDAALAKERDQCNHSCGTAMEEVRAIQAETSRLNNEAWANRQAANAFKIRWEQKMEMMQKAQEI